MNVASVVKTPEVVTKSNWENNSQLNMCSQFSTVQFGECHARHQHVS